MKKEAQVKKRYALLTVLCAFILSGCIINGFVKNESGQGVSDVTMTLSGPKSDSVTTDATGKYQFDDNQNWLPVGTYTVTPAKDGYRFSPSSQTVTITTRDYNGTDTAWPVNNVDFEANRGETTRLTYSDFFPHSHLQSQMAESWCQEVGKRTEGRVTVQYFAGGELLPYDEAYEGIVTGIIDVGTSAVAYTQDRFPVMGAIDLPFGYTSSLAATNAANALYAKLKPEEFDETQVMYFNAHGPGLIHTRNKAVTSLEDIRGLKIRSSGMSAEVMTALGATPVLLPITETYEALEKGVVDGFCYPTEVNQRLDLGEVVDYVIKEPAAAYTTNFFVVMNKAIWESLDAKDQAIITAINQEWAIKHAEAWDSSDKEGMAYFLSQEGNQVIELEATESARWKEAVAPLIDAYAEDLDAKGLDGQAVVDTLRGVE